MSSMTMTVELHDGSAVELQGTDARYWKGIGEPDYVGPIYGLPNPVLEELIARKVIKRGYNSHLPGFFKWPKT